ncbi:unnamed protein product [Symbiodinium sp. CCMP2456]|nr:unnamed protein product [Symbiodinium sp. CCMP2456]
MASAPKEKKDADFDCFLFLKTGFFACLNFVDMVTDILVLLQFGCLFGKPLRTDCNATSALDSDTSETCEVHPWWLAISALILGCSSIGSAAMYSHRRREGVKSHGVRSFAAAISFVASLLQLAPFMDLLHMLRHGNRFMDKEKKMNILRRETIIKLVESAPQAFFQAYVLFATGSHGQPLQVFSLTVSILSLSTSLLVSLPELTEAEKMIWRGGEREDDSSDPLTESDDAPKPAAHDPPEEESQVGHEEEAPLLEQRELMSMLLYVAAKAKARQNAKRKTYRQSVAASRQSRRGEVDDQARLTDPPAMMLGSSAAPPEGQTLAEDPLHEKNPPIKVLSLLHDSMIGKFFFWIYLVSDTLLRCGAYALGFSEVVRPIGIPLAIIFAVCQVALSFWETTCVILHLVWLGLRALLRAICWLVGLARRSVAQLPEALRFLFSGSQSPPLPETSDGPQDWDVECAEACLPCLPCFLRIVKFFWCIATPIGLAIALVFVVFLAVLGFLAYSPFLALIAIFWTLIGGCFAIAVTAAPVVATLNRDPRHKTAFVMVRLIEYLSFGALLVFSGQSACGEEGFSGNLSLFLCACVQRFLYPHLRGITPLCCINR